MRHRLSFGLASRTVLLSLALALIPVVPGAWAEPVTTIRDNGDPANRLDVVIVGDGYTAAEMGRYASDVERFVQGLFSQQPFLDYQQYFNVHRVDVLSNDSGADHPERTPPFFVDTALNAFYNCSAQRTICVDVGEVLAVVSRSLPPEARDVVLVLVNDPEYGGSGGAVAVASVHPDAVEVILHELGHTLGLLADEYGGPAPPVCSAAVEPPEINATRVASRPQIKWSHWIDGSTPIPTTGTSAGVPGLYEGAKYCDSGLFRPTYNSKMRSLQVPFEQVNTEQLVSRFYNWVSPIDSIQPDTSSLSLPQGQTQVFQVQVPLPLSHPLSARWDVDGVTAGTGLTFTLSSAALAIGPHVVKVTVTDATPLVRNDPLQALTDFWQWDVAVTPPHTIVISSGPGGTPNPVGSAGVTNLSVLATDSFGHNLNYSWTASCPGLVSNGSFSGTTARNPKWTAPANTTGIQQACTISISVSDGAAGLNRNASYSQIVSPFIIGEPGGLAATAVSSTQIALTWADNSNNETQFRVERRPGAAATWAQIATPGANVVSYVNGGLIAGATYVYRVRACNAGGCSPYSNEASATTLAAARVTIGPTSLDFGSVAVNTCRTAQFAIQHVSGTASASGTIAVSPRPPFLITQNASWTAVGSDGPIAGVQFCPTKTGLSTGTVTITTTALANTKTVTLRGVGVNTGLGELLVNGGFESGSVGWVRAGAFQADSRFGNPYSGNGYAYLANSDGSPGNNLLGSLYQTVTVPSTASSATLTYWYSITTQETAAAPFDVLNVTIQNGSGGFLATVAVHSNLQPSTAYRQQNYDVSSFRGQTIRVNFLGVTDVSLPTVFRVDAVSLVSQ